MRDAVRLTGLRLVAVLGDPDGHRAVEPLLQVLLELGSVESVTFGKRTFSSGFALGDVGYGWCAHASNFRPGCFASSCANIPGETVWLTPVARLVAALRGGLADRDLREPGCRP